MRFISSRFISTDVDLKFPRPLAESIVIGGLTPAQLRVALVLVASMRPDGSVLLEKPFLERLAGMQMDNAARVLAPLMDAVIERPDGNDPDVHGMKVFSSIEYKHGVRKTAMGMVEARISVAMQYALTSQYEPISVPADEFRHYAAIGSLILRLRLGAELAYEPGAQKLVRRLTAENLGETFGSYSRMAVMTRKTKSGDIEMLSLARAGEKLVDIAVRDINGICRAMLLKPHVVVDGVGGRRPWAAIDIEVRRMHVLQRKIKGFSGIQKAPAPTPAPIKLKGGFRAGVPGT